MYSALDAGCQPKKALDMLRCLKLPRRAKRGACAKRKALSGAAHGVPGATRSVMAKTSWLSEVKIGGPKT